MRGEDARQLNLKNVSDAANRPRSGMRVSATILWFDRTATRDFRAYGLKFAGVSDMALDLTYTALASRKVDMIAGNSTDGRIAALDLVQRRRPALLSAIRSGVLYSQRVTIYSDGESEFRTSA